MAVERLRAGQAFHRTVQSAFLTGLAGASGFKERQWRHQQLSSFRPVLAERQDSHAEYPARQQVDDLEQVC